MTASINGTQHNYMCAIMLTVIMLSVTFYLLLFRMSLRWVLLCWMSLCWVSWRQKWINLRLPIVCIGYWSYQQMSEKMTKHSSLLARWRRKKFDNIDSRLMKKDSMDLEVKLSFEMTPQHLAEW